MLSLKEQEGIAKGFSNHYRIRILELLELNNDLSLEDITFRLKANYKTISVHTQKLHRASLIEKNYRANSVLHKLTSRGRYVLKFLRKLE